MMWTEIWADIFTALTQATYNTLWFLMGVLVPVGYTLGRWGE